MPLLAVFGTHLATTAAIAVTFAWRYGGNQRAAAAHVLLVLLWDLALVAIVAATRLTETRCRNVWTPAQRGGVYDAANDTLARLHRIDPAAVGLGDFGRHGNYFARQVSRWAKQYAASKTEDIPEMEQLATWLAERVPPETAAVLSVPPPLR